MFSTLFILLIFQCANGQCDSTTPPKENSGATLQQSVDFIKKYSDCMKIDSLKKTEVAKTVASSREKKSQTQASKVQGTKGGTPDNPVLVASSELDDESGWELIGINGCSLTWKKVDSSIRKAEMVTILLSDLNPQAIKSSEQRITKHSGSITGTWPGKKRVDIG